MSPNRLLILGLVSLLLPAVLAWVVRPPAGAAPDPWRVRRARLTVTLFPVLVAVIYLGTSQLVNALNAAGTGLLIWSAMSWFFFAGLLVEVRRGRPDPFPGRTQRSASLKPRHAESLVPALAWWLLGAAWAGAASWFWWAPEAGTISMILALGAGIFVAMGPWMARRAQLDAEPLLADAHAGLRRLYAARRRVRAWTIFAQMAGTVAVNLLFAFEFGPGMGDGWRWPRIALAMLLIVATCLVGVLLERRLVRRIRGLRVGLADRNAT